VAQGRQDKLFRAAGWATGLNLLLNATVIPFWGMAGAALVTVATEAARTGLALRYCRLAGLPFPSLRRFWRALISGTAMAGVLGFGGIETFWAALAVGAVVYLLTLYLVGGVKFVPGALPELTV
jgi:O-antigen/teichoic acid export membrane protein